MNGQTRWILWVGLFGSSLSLLFASQAEAARGNEAGAASAGVQVRMFNVARVFQKDLVRAEAEASRIFTETGIELRWTEGRVDDTSALIQDFSDNHSSAGGCRGELNASELRVQLLPRSPRGVPAGTLGFSLPCARFGVDSTIYIEQCEAVTSNYHMLVGFSKVLGHVIAHELGHVLLRSSEHSASGLMRAHWDVHAWVRAAEGDIRIEQGEARRMRREVLRMGSAEVAALR